jgi:hypothetical protein
VGRRDRVSEDALMELLSKGDVPPDQVLGIRVRDRMTFLTVKRDFADRSTLALAGHELGGRTLVAELARDRSNGRGQNRSY